MLPRTEFPRAAASESGPSFLSLLYWPGSEEFLEESPVASLERPAETGTGIRANTGLASSLLPATALAEGDAQFARSGARIYLRGVIPELHSRNRRFSLTISADFRPFHEARFTAWRFDYHTVPNLGSPISFTMPIAHPGGLNLHVQFEERIQEQEKAHPQAMEFPVRLALGRATGEAKLRRGAYFLTILSGGKACFPHPAAGPFPPDKPRAKFAPRLSRRPDRYEPVDFTYAALWIDYAEAPLSGNAPVV